MWWYISVISGLRRTRWGYIVRPSKKKKRKEGWKDGRKEGRKEGRKDRKDRKTKILTVNNPSNAK
jgi:hypothetical protein